LHMVIAFVIAVVALLVITVAWGSTMDIESNAASRPRQPRPRVRRTRHAA
jgi:hypothetical protein